MRQLLKKIRARQLQYSLERCTYSLPEVFLRNDDRISKSSPDFEIYNQLLETYMRLIRIVRRLDKETFDELQKSRIKKILYIAQKSTWWKKHLSDHSVYPNHPDWMERFRSLPPTDRTILGEIPKEQLFTSSMHDPAIWWRRTSGSTTGTPFMWAIDKRASILNALASFLEEFESLGFSFEKNKDRDFFAQYNISWPIQLIQNFSGGTVIANAYGKNIDERTELVLRDLLLLHADIIYTTPSSARFLTMSLEKRGIRPSIPFFLFTGEPSNRELENYVGMYLGSKIVSLYGTQETASLGVSCRDTPGFYHVLERVHVELLDKQGAAVPEGVPGYITITCLDNWLMPMIRYQPGDLGVFYKKGTCSCKTNAPLLEVTGRSSDTLVLKNGDSGSASGLLRLFGKEPFFSLVKKFRIVQTKAGIAHIYLEMHKKPMPLSLTKEISGALVPMYGDQLHIEVEEVSSISQTGEKFKAFVPMH